MELTRTEQALIDAIRACRHKGFYHQVRWQFSQAISPEVRITNSVKAAFSRAKRDLGTRRRIKEDSVLPYQLTSDEFLDYAIHVTSSPTVVAYRRALLPLVISRSTTAEFASFTQKLTMTEEEIFERTHWDKMKISEVDLREARQILTQCLKRIYEMLAPRFSDIFKSQHWRGRDVEILLSMLVSITHGDSFYHGWSKRSFVNMFDTLRNHFLDLFPDELFSEIIKYETALTSYANIFEKHRRRVYLKRHLNDFRSISRFDRHGIPKNPSGAKKQMDERNKQLLLERVYLAPNDFQFMESEYSKWTSADLNSFLAELLKIPEVKIKVLSEVGKSTQ